MHRMLYWLLGVIVSLHSVAAERGVEIIFNDLTFTLFDHELVSNYSCGLTPNSASKNVMNCFIEVTKDINDARAKFSIDLLRNGKYEKYSYLNTDYDICKSLGVVQGNVLVRLIAAEIKKSGNLPDKCPLRKTLKITNFSVDAKTFLPKYTPEVDWRVNIEFNVWKKPVFNLTLCGAVKIKKE